MTASDRIEDLLEQWEMARIEGNAPSVAELCKNDPELLDEVEQRVAILQDLSWTLDPLGLVDHSDEITNPISLDLNEDSDVTITEFVETLSDSGILNAQQLGQVRENAAAGECTVQAFAKELVEQNIVTPYQAKVILDRGDSPLLLDRYIILDSIGAGGMGVVFKALQRSLERVVAVKVLPKHAVDSKEKVERFQREIRMAAKLSHPNVVQAFDAHESNGVYFLVMEYVDGCDLAALLEEHGPLPAPEAVDLIKQVAAGLASAHDLRIVHRDVKPANVLLGEDGVAKVLDLGLARTRERVQTTSVNDLTRDGLAMGTVNYMSPEQAFDAKRADERSDIYSLGCTLYFLLHGKPPFERENSIQTVIAHREESAPKLSEGLDDVTPEIESVFQRMLAKDPDARPATMSEVRALLSSDDLATEHPSPKAARSKPSGSAKRTLLERYYWVFPLITLLVVGLTIVGLIMNLKADNPRSLAESLLRNDALSLTLSSEEFEAYEVGYASDLPDGDFKITGASLYLEDGDNLNLIAELKDLDSISVISMMADESIAVDLTGLKNHPEITDLYLSECELDKDAISQIVRCKRLVSLSMVGCKISDGNSLQQIGELPSLRDLTLDGTNLDISSLSFLEKCDTIELVDISNTSLSTDVLPILTKLPKLDVLYLTGLEISDLAPLKSMGQLTSLSLDATDFGDAEVSVLADIENLDFLDVSHSQLSPAGLQSVCKLPALSHLSIRGLNIESSIEHIAAISNLKTLHAGNTDLSDSGLRKLESAKGLQTISIDSTNVTDAAVDRFLRLLPACDVLTESDLDEDSIE